MEQRLLPALASDTRLRIVPSLSKTARCVRTVAQHPSAGLRDSLVRGRQDVRPPSSKSMPTQPSRASRESPRRPSSRELAASIAGRRNSSRLAAMVAFDPSLCAIDGAPLNSPVVTRPVFRAGALADERAVACREKRFAGSELR